MEPDSLKQAIRESEEVESIARELALADDPDEEVVEITDKAKLHILGES